MWSRQPYHIGLRIQDNTYFTYFFLLADRRRPNMIGNIFLKNEKFSSSYPGVSNFLTNQNPAFYRCFQILGLGWGLQRPGKQGVCVVCIFFCCDVLLVQAVLAPVELQNIVIVTNLCYIFPVLFSLILQVWLHCHICFPPFSALQVFAVFLRFASAGFVLYHFFRPDRPIAQVVHNSFLLFLFCAVFFSCSFTFL